MFPAARRRAVVDRLLHLYPLLLYALGGVYLLSWPITKIDTDLWFHLSWGRELFERGSIPYESTFSFITPPKSWVDYAWLFQALVSLCHASAGYAGLIVLRSVLYLATTGLLLWFLRGSRARETERGWRTFLFGLTWMILLPRYLLVRPFLWTDVFTMAFIILLERRPRGILVLPLLGILWCNLHGIAYPILLLIAGAYSAEYLWSRLRGMRHQLEDERWFFVPAVLSMAAVFLTPHGLRLLEAPFRSLAYLSTYVAELWAWSAKDFLTFEVTRLTPTFETVCNVAWITVVLALLVSCLRRRVRLSHLVMCLGGLVLLTRGPRFVAESTLLALPLLQATPLAAGHRSVRRAPAPTVLAVAGLLLLLPVTFAATLFGRRPAYPLSLRGLPEGVVTFLNQVGEGGDLLNHPNNGGYFRWRLKPGYRIFIDMEALFKDEEFHFAKHAFLEHEPLRQLVTRYDPSFITVPHHFTWFPGLIARFPQYELVFFDDVEVLYVNRRRHPALARGYALRGLDPFQLSAQSPEALLAGPQAKAWVDAVPRLLEIYPEGGVVRQLAATHALQEGDSEQALAHAEIICRRYPDAAIGYRLKGEALRGLGRFDEALRAYRLAAARLDPADRGHVYTAMGRMWLERGRPKRAYALLIKAVDVFDAETPVRDLYDLGVAARLAGKPRVAKAVLSYLMQFKVAPDDPKWAQTLQEEFARLGISSGPMHGAGGTR